MWKYPERRLDRRAFLRGAASLTASALLFPGRALAQVPIPEVTDAPEFVPGHLRYTGGRWQEYPSAMASFLEEVRARTSIEASRDAVPVDIGSPAIFEHPFLYLSGRYEFEMPEKEAIERLRRHLTYGGFLLIDDGLGLEKEGFGGSVHKLVERIFPRRGLEPLPHDHAVFRSYYLLRSVGGRQAVSQELLGIQIGIFTPIIFCRNDLGGAWARRAEGGWVEECVPGGELQRRAAFQLGVNVALYAMTGNYKHDLIHHPFIQRRLNQG